MAKFTKTTKNTGAATAATTEKGKARVTRCNLVNIPDCPWITAFANVIYDGTVFMQSIAVRENKEGEPYLTFPSKKRTKNGQDVLDDNGKVIYDEIYGPADAETRKGLQELIFAAVQDKFDGKETPQTAKGENKALVNLVEGHEGLVAMANVVYTGKFFMTGITVNEVQNGERAGDVYLSYPSRKRTKAGQDVLDENGKVIYDPYFGPGSEESRKALEEMIFPAVQDAITEAESK